MSSWNRSSFWYGRSKKANRFSWIRFHSMGADLDANESLRVYRLNGTGASTTNNKCLVLQQADTTNNPISLEVINAGTGNGVFIDQNGNGVALNIDAETANDGAIVDVVPAGTSPGAFSVYRDDDVDGNVVLRLGNTYIWADSSNVLRVDSVLATGDTDGTVVGSQT